MLKALGALKLFREIIQPGDIEMLYSFEIVGYFKYEHLGTIVLPI